MLREGIRMRSKDHPVHASCSSSSTSMLQRNGVLRTRSASPKRSLACCLWQSSMAHMMAC
jgi:hypothetical protein